MNLITPAKYVSKGFSNEIEQQLEEILDYENKINDLLLKKITEFITENKALTEVNKNSQIQLKTLQISMRNAQKDAENWQEEYKIFQLKNKDMLAKLQNDKKLTKSNVVDYFEELPRKTSKHLDENKLSSRIYFTNDGL